MRIGLVVALAGCGVDSPPMMQPVQPPDIAYSLHVGEQQPRPTVQPAIYIDGAATSSVSQTYPPGETAFAHHVELRYEDHVLATYDTSADIENCGQGSNARGALVSVGISLDAYDSGDLRFSSDQIQFEQAGCLGDGFDLANCWCAPTERCMPRVTLADPLFTRLACAPIGPKQDGDACAAVPDPDGAYDDCGAGLFCYQGTCHALCGDSPLPPGFGGVALPDGYPSGALLCD